MRPRPRREVGMGSASGRVIAVILARAGSRGVPGKNVASVGGRPCIEWTIDHALSASSPEAVVVSLAPRNDAGKMVLKETGVTVIRMNRALVAATGSDSSSGVCVMGEASSPLSPWPGMVAK